VKRVRLLAAIAAASLALLAGCASPPAHVKPSVDVPANWRPAEGWQQARPDDAAQRGPWWKRFGDSTLDSLQEQALAASPTVAIAAARLAQARASVDIANAGLFPSATVGARAQRFEISANRPLTNYASPNFQTVQSDFALSFNVAYEADLFGRIRSGLQAAQATAEQSQADFQNTRLVLTGDVAAAYFNLRQLDIELDVLAKSIALQRRSFDLAKARHDLGATSGLDVAQQQALLDATLTQVDVLRRQRGQFQNALAALTGKPAPDFSLPSEVPTRNAPPVPLALPSEVLQRRPDVASAERAMAAANAQIGVARAAFYPTFTIGPSFGVQTRDISRLFDAPSMLWSLGVAAVQPIFDAGRADASTAFATAGYQASVANYRRVVLTAFQEVQDGIDGSAALDRALAQARVAEASAQRVLQLATDRYEGGAASYLEVITAQQSLLNSQRQAAQLLGQRLLVTVALVKALGGDW
jgi:NodT family efflux transporter outer membrane factor (OMF) lipoprotein